MEVKNGQMQWKIAAARVILVQAIPAGSIRLNPVSSKEDIVVAGRNFGGGSSREQVMMRGEV